MAIAQFVARGSHNPKVVSSILTRRIFEHLCYCSELPPKQGVVRERAHCFVRKTTTTTRSLCGICPASRERKRNASPSGYSNSFWHSCGFAYPTDDFPSTRTWNLRLQRPTPYPLGQQIFRTKLKSVAMACASVQPATVVNQLLNYCAAWRRNFANISRSPLTSFFSFRYGAR